MNSSITAPWPQRALGNEQALEHTTSDLRMLFGLGPPQIDTTHLVRTEELLETLTPEIRSICWGDQIHGRLVASVIPEPGKPFSGVTCVGKCDALITDEPGVGLLVWSADCVPVLLSSGDVVAAVHSGWRGTAADVLGAVVDRFRTEFGVLADSLEAALGPSISGPLYEVSQQVADALSNYEIDPGLWRDENRVDLRELLTGRLQQLGVQADRIARIGPCTAGSMNLASYRRDGTKAGRQWSIIYRKD